MPFYDYYCEKNGQTIEVFHGINTRLKTWGEVCDAAGVEPGRTPRKTPVIRLISGEPIVWRLKGLDKDAPSKKLEL